MHDLGYDSTSVFEIACTFQHSALSNRGVAVAQAVIERQVKPSAIFADIHSQDF
jgi:hypothetical protein